MTAMLYQAALGPLSLAEALAHLPDGNPTALLYGRRSCRFARINDGVLMGPDEAVDPSEIYEARVFDRRFELRWMQTEVVAGERRGPAVLLHDGEVDLADSVSRPVLETRAQPYILWGRADAQTVYGWSRLVAARIGALWVPIEVGEGQSVRLLAREYLEQARDSNGTTIDGNVVVGEERLIGIEPLPG